MHFGQAGLSLLELPCQDMAAAQYIATTDSRTNQASQLPMLQRTKLPHPSTQAQKAGL